MEESTRSPLARLVLFMVCLSIAGSVVAAAHYYAIDIPEQQDVQPPANSGDFCLDAVAQNIVCSCMNNRYGSAGFAVCMEGGQKAYSCTINAMQVIGMSCG
ncbi:MAG: hypothetical protein M0R30_04325 [Methanoregula sp.]|uniref:hypothetical protein n=1 Tax=Methanoregula sp. TaxID=2052170 RepID=UPI002600C4EA|nr:hypothetical protein [Methanoregula sp.]MCK9630845.1 hypothetical protein [Methanoregula sp.]